MFALHVLLRFAIEERTYVNIVKNVYYLKEITVNIF